MRATSTLINSHLIECSYDSVVVHGHGIEEYYPNKIVVDVLGSFHLAAAVDVDVATTMMKKNHHHPHWILSVTSSP